jgi:hypothetical protein
VVNPATLRERVRPDQRIRREADTEHRYVQLAKVQDRAHPQRPGMSEHRSVSHRSRPRVRGRRRHSDRAHRAPTAAPADRPNASHLIMRRFRGDDNPPQRVPSRHNRSQQGTLTCVYRRSRMSARRFGNFDTVGVTGSIPVSPTRHMRWSDSLLVIITDGLFLRCGSIVGATDLDHTSHTVVVAQVRAPTLLPAPL